MLTGFLDYQRATVLRKVEGLSEKDLRRPMVPSGVTPLGMVKHLAGVERWWFRMCFAGEDVAPLWTEEDEDADWKAGPDETTEDILGLYRAECDLSRAITDAAPTLDERARRARFEKYTLRWILVHMIEETARHNGHADIIRELIDGTTGE